MTNTEILSGEISSLAFGGHGIVRQDNFVVFLPFGAIGDKINYRITQRKKNFAWGEIVDVLVPSPDRVKAPCPYFGVCGGCQLQHLNYTAQLAAKRLWIADALERQANIKIEVPTVIAASQQWAYRRRITLTLKPSEEGYRAGYVGVDPSVLVEVNQCPIFNEPADPIVRHVQGMAKEFVCADWQEAKMTILKSGDAQYLISCHFKKIPSNCLEVIKKGMNGDRIKGIVAADPHKTLKVGSFETSMQIEGLEFDFSPQAFIQNHPEQSSKIYEAIQSCVLEMQPKMVFDLYCGIGISSLLAARHCQNVIGVEMNAQAVKLAEANARKNKLENVSFIQAPVENALGKLLKKPLPELIILNPPREGLAQEALSVLVKASPPKLLYISCMPATLARDLKVLCQAGYKLTSVQGYDMFPQTTHVETLAVLQL